MPRAGCALHATKKTASARSSETSSITVAAEPGSVAISTSVLTQKNKSRLGRNSTVDIS